MASTTQTPPRRVAMISYHTCPLARLGGQKTGGMNVYVRDFSQALAATGVQVDVFTRLQPGCEPVVNHELGPNCRVIHIPAGPDRLVSLREMERYLDEFTAGVLAFAAAEGAHYDLIHSHYWLSGLDRRAAAHGLGRRPLGADVPHPGPHEERHRPQPRRAGLSPAAGRRDPAGRTASTASSPLRRRKSSS